MLVSIFGLHCFLFNPFLIFQGGALQAQDYACFELPQIATYTALGGVVGYVKEQSKAWTFDK